MRITNTPAATGRRARSPKSISGEFAVFWRARVNAQGEQTLATVNLEGDPRDALARLIHSSWRLVDASRAFVVAAQEELSPARMRQLHDEPAARVESLIERGRCTGAFRTDMPTSWLVAVLHQIIHGAGAEIDSGRLQPDDASPLICATAFAVLDMN